MEKIKENITKFFQRLKIKKTEEGRSCGIQR